MCSELWFCVILCIVLINASQDCEPLGLRLNYGRIIYSASEQKLALRFNTRSRCDNIQLILNGNTIVHCPIRMTSNYLHEPHSQNYTTFIHTCSLTSQIQFDTRIAYNLINLRNKAKALKEDISIFIRNPMKTSQEFKFIHIADYGPITNEEIINKLEPIIEALSNLIEQSQVDGIIVNGDIGYELNSNTQHHELVLKTISIVTSKVPLIINRGNHETNDQQHNAGTMFEEYFELYDLEKHQATGLSIGPVYLALVDPLKALIPRHYDHFSQQELHKSFRSYQQFLKKGKQLNKNIVALCHYPLICGYPAVQHCIPHQKYGQILPLYINLKDLVSSTIKYSVSLVLSGHVHIYERSHPVYQGYRVKPLTTNSYARSQSNKFFIQVVEGACGSNSNIYQDYTLDGKTENPSRLIASHCQNKTGFGVLFASEAQLRYEHYSLNKGGNRQLVDNFSIILEDKEAANTRDEL